MELKNIAALVSRTGRHMQRYNFHGQRQVVGCIPYRFRVRLGASMVDEEDIEVLVISAQRKGKGMMFPKGGWENDESIEEAAARETVEEAGVVGDVEVSVREARMECQHLWMKEALELLLHRLINDPKSQQLVHLPRAGNVAIVANA
ncbi:hypothetical protein ACS0TY_028878 [Phlomoides rotata]